MPQLDRRMNPFIPRSPSGDEAMNQADEDISQNPVQMKPSTGTATKAAKTGNKGEKTPNL
jgi:hypothetical protein